jgi:uncharacterized membrane protein
VAGTRSPPVLEQTAQQQATQKATSSATEALHFDAQPEAHAGQVPDKSRSPLRFFWVLILVLLIMILARMF